jgi:hypothetical protein
MKASVKRGADFEARGIATRRSTTPWSRLSPSSTDCEEESSAPTSLTALLEEFDRRGVRAYRINERIVRLVPRAAVTPDLIKRVLRQKTALLKILPVMPLDARGPWRVVVDGSAPTERTIDFQGTKIYEPAHAIKMDLLALNRIAAYLNGDEQDRIIGAYVEALVARLARCGVDARLEVTQ